MRYRPIPSLAAVLLTALTAAAPLAATGLEGWAQLGLTQPSWLGGVDLPALEQSACGVGGIRGSILLITNDGGGSHLTVAVVGTTAGPHGATVAQVAPTSLYLAGGDPLAFACGAYRYHLILDPEAVQPVSEITVLLDADGSGTCEGTLGVAARLVLQPLTGGPRLESPHPMKLRIAGPCALTDPRPLAPGESPLALLAAEGQDRRLVPAPARLTAEDPDTSLWFAAVGSAVARPRE